MKILISGVCGFAGSHLARYLLESHEGIEIVGLDNLARQGSETNRLALKRLGVRLVHGDLRMASDVDVLPSVDWVIDAAAQPSVLAGRDGQTSARQLLEHNLLSTVNLLEYCRTSRAGFILLSTSRVYSIPELARLPLVVGLLKIRTGSGAAVARGGKRSRRDGGLQYRSSHIDIRRVPKLASERLAREYAFGFQVPVWINRCGVLAGPGQFGTAEQGIFSYWLHAHAARRTLKYLGFGGHGHQVRDALHPRDLARMVDMQLRNPGQGGLQNVSGGAENSMSMAQLTAWCDKRFGPNEPVADGSDRPYDVPWLVLDSARAQNRFRLAARHRYRHDSRGDRSACHRKSRLAGKVRRMKSPAPSAVVEELKLLSVIMPARDEEGCIASTVEHLHVELRLHNVPHEIIVVDDVSKLPIERRKS